ncbi:MAG: baseplate J/gp47 family protein [Cyanomargarita calcarea GSE-NOS-MK-12-04C]|jgi:uncharacterized phage protein gp47/JayE|uniref:Baseplate J/gp47 family protein n=1 Tax=Cyanomargarita calcarea GSE-NOS-MK-12-04C TaxID=2839659 RepID=A0A951QIU0_9CYAN|nr:baseplate J/gp47 family protein [Cyanomargarita calcarea GSE-NOS-MK-12-04C]
MPQVDTTTAQQLLDASIQRAIAVSNGKLTDFSPVSPVTAILEAGAIAGSTVITKVNELASTLEANCISYFGVERRLGRVAVGTIKIDLDGVYAEPFLLPSGFRFSNSGMTWETTQEVSIPPYQTSGNAFAIALTIGDFSDNAITYSPIPRVASITWLEEPSGGQDVETDEEWKARILGSLRRRDTLLSEDDFEDTVQEYLGIGSVALAVGRLKPDKATYGNGYVGVFGLNPDGTIMSEAQRSQLESFLNRKAAMALVTLWNVDTFDINVSAIAGILPTANPDNIAPLVQAKITEYLKPGNLPLGDLILNKAIEKRIQDIPGVAEGIVSVKLNGLAQPQTLPNRWTVGKLGKLELILVNQGREFKY